METPVRSEQMIAGFLLVCLGFEALLTQRMEAALLFSLAGIVELYSALSDDLRLYTLSSAFALGVSAWCVVRFGQTRDVLGVLVGLYLSVSCLLRFRRYAGWR